MWRCAREWAFGVDGGCARTVRGFEFIYRWRVISALKEEGGVEALGASEERCYICEHVRTLAVVGIRNSDL
jgi:hypothetical protein